MPYDTDEEDSIENRLRRIERNYRTAMIVMVVLILLTSGSVLTCIMGPPQFRIYERAQGFAAMGPDSQRRAVLGVPAPAPLPLPVSSDAPSPSLTLYDDRGGVRAALYLANDAANRGKPYLRFFDEEGKLIWSAP